MSEDWRPGDLGICISIKHPDFSEESKELRVGSIYTVGVVGYPHPSGERALGLKEVSSPKPRHGFPESLFTKIHPHAPDEQDAETIELLNGVPVRETA